MIQGTKANEASQQIETPSEQGLGGRLEDCTIVPIGQPNPESIRRHRYDESTNRYAIMYQCPHCKAYDVHVAYQSTIDNVAKEGSKKAPLRAFCSDPLGSCHSPKSKGDKRGRGRTSVRLISRDANHCLAMVPVKNKSKLDLVASNLNVCVYHGQIPSYTDAVREYDASYTSGQRLPKAFRRVRGV